MRRLRLISCMIVTMLFCPLLAPVAGAASTFAADLNLYETNNKTTSDAARELTAYVTGELLFARSLGRIVRQYPLLVRDYRSALNQVNSATQRIIRDQRTSERLLTDVRALAGEKRMEAAWIILKRGATGQGRFLTTIAKARLLVTRCNLLHAELTRMGG